MFEGVPNYPSMSRFWEVIDKHKVNIFYTAPTAIRALMQAGDAPVTKTSRASLRLLGSVGEPINPEAWEWYHRVVGDGRCPIVDTWWQTETGGILITPLPGATRLKPGSATRPFFGVVPQIVDAEGKVLGGRRQRQSLHRRFLARPDAHRLWRSRSASSKPISAPIRASISPATAAAATRTAITGSPAASTTSSTSPAIASAPPKSKSALVAHPKVSEAAVVGYPHDIKGQGIYAYVTLMTGVQPTEELRKELVQWVRTEIGPIASPDLIQFAPSLPKTRSGKIMRRILRKIAEDEFGNLGDTSTLGRSRRGRRSGQQPAEQEQGERVAFPSSYPSPLWGGAGVGLAGKATA